MGQEPAWKAFETALEDMGAHEDGRPVAPSLDAGALRRRLEERYSFREALPAAALVEDMAAMLRDGTVHVTHPRYFGLFNPSVHPVSVVADALVARGRAWISKVRLPGQGWVLRACITSYRTGEGDLEALVSELGATGGLNPSRALHPQ